ncbi:Tyramine N-feruloyltransferase 4/11 [Apostasia shenzhenica]|uniref:Tyramine N-feruloyltransferase 4/11 n=1 Tax=Apostasia shenzhenica TaxID=1088818 RepID=A0A2I0BF67_9ASPA|nr:Tyramine N-feruloyltransferase 4/11 [Apostasia shenzhenica]
MSASSSAAAAASLSEQPAVWARIRLADRRDVPNIHRLIFQMAEFERLTHLFHPTESSLSSTLFPSPPLPPFRSFTVLILELSGSPISNAGIDADEEEKLGFRPIVRRISLDVPVEDADSTVFASPQRDGLVVAGYLLCFPNYSSFEGRPGLYVEDIFVREAWRRKGMGRMLLEAAARDAARLGYGRVEWCVLDWNKNAISFYEEMGAEVLPQWRICRLSGEALGKYAGDDEAACGC